jgi:cytochrome P450
MESAINNVIATAFWVTLEVFRDSTLLGLIRSEVRSCLIYSEKTPGIRGPTFDITRLVQQPFLQAAYAETLRLRVNGFFLWRVPHHDIDIRGWQIRQNHYVATSPTPGHMDPTIWCTGDNAGHPVDELYVGRWVKSMSSPAGLPVKNDTSSAQVQFTTEFARGAWIPFGGGYHSCPGRRFAKIMVALTAALLVMMYDCEFLSNVEEVGMSMRTFGFGTLGPDRKVPVRMRRRVTPT